MAPPSLSNHHHHFILKILFTSVLLQWSSATVELSLSEQLQLYDQMSESPLSKNPFFMKVLSISGSFEKQGTEGMSSDITGYTCRWLGNMECKSFDFKCDGIGAVDCSGKCPGDEVEFVQFIGLMSDKALVQNFSSSSKQQLSLPTTKMSNDTKRKYIAILNDCNFTQMESLLEKLNFSSKMSHRNNDGSSLSLSQEYLFQQKDFKLGPDATEHEDVFLEAFKMAYRRDLTTRRKRSKDSNYEEMVESLVNKIKGVQEYLKRTKRSDILTSANEKCKVRNLTCVSFPTTAQCAGIAIGGCMSTSKLLSLIFTPRMILSICGAFLLLAILILGLVVYIRKRKKCRRVQDDDDDDDDD